MDTSANEPVFSHAPGSAPDASDPLPSWTDGAAKSAVMQFIARVTDRGSPDFVLPADRVAVFDNDGTLWSEKPLYVQLQFAIERIRQLAPAHPEWKHQQPFQGILEGDLEGAAAGGVRAITELVMASHAGITTEEFEAVATEWIETARHPRWRRPYTDLIYQPMQELIRCLHATGFHVYIVSGGGIEFMRPWVERIYRVPRSHVIGSSIVTELVERKGEPVLMRRPEIDFIDDGPGKPVAIDKFIGRRPLAAFGNSDGDLEMLEWTTAGAGARFALLVHHTDAEREWAYDRDTKIGKLYTALDKAKARGWTVVDMKQSWRRIFPFDE